MVDRDSRRLAMAEQAKERHTAFRQSGDPEELAAAIQLQEAVVTRAEEQGVPAGFRSRARNELGFWLMEHYQHTGEEASLALGIEVLERLVAETPAALPTAWAYRWEQCSLPVDRLGRAREGRTFPSDRLTGIE